MIGTIVIVVLVSVVLSIAIGRLLFQHKIKRQKDHLFSIELDTDRISEQDLAHFPPLLKNYLIKAGVIGKSRYCNLTFQQKGTIKTDPNKDWMSFKATQYMSTGNSGFIWSACAFPLYIVDSYLDGKGAVKVNLLGLKNVAVYATPETAQSALGRYFGELLWFPIGFLDEDIAWETVDDSTVKGIIHKDGLTFNGYFHFSEDGWIHSFKGKRYKDTQLEDFTGKAEHYTLMNGLYIPRQMTAIWELETGSYPYFKATVFNYRVTENR